jgi:transcriptional/translational regulatory protein YebC/TACO1
MCRVKASGPDAKANVQLAAVLQTARQANIPKDIIDRNIKKASDKDQAEYVAQTYEVCHFSLASSTKEGPWRLTLLRSFLEDVC